MDALVLNAVNEPLSFQSLADLKAEPGHVVVSLMASALNHRDLFITRGLYAGIRLPVIPGSDGAGLLGDRRVVIYPALEWGDSPDFQGKDFRVLGMPDNGTFAQYVAVPQSSVYDMPAHLTWEQAAALPLAGLTAWRTLFSRCKLQRGEKVLITGIGGGVALTALQLAVAAGATVYVTSGSNDKINKAVELGAAGGENYGEDGWDKRLKQNSGGFDVVIDSAGGNGFSLLPGMCNPGARIGFYGGTLGKVNGLSLQPVFWKQISLLGSTMGSQEEFGEMLRFVEAHRIVPVVDEVFRLEDGNEAMEKMRNGNQFGKLVLRNAV
jgi:NADPH:quinone reductase-like Zn-dependent oxidoreductase